MIPASLYEKIIGKIDNIDKEKLFEINGTDDLSKRDNTTNDEEKKSENDNQVTINDLYNKVSDLDSDLKEVTDMNTQDDLTTPQNPVTLDAIYNKINDIDSNLRQTNDVSTQTDLSKSVSAQTEPMNTLRSFQPKQKKFNYNNDVSTQTNSTKSKSVSTQTEPRNTLRSFQPTQNKFKCTICNNFYSTKWVLKRHVQTQHEQKKENEEKIQKVIKNQKESERKVDENVDDLFTSQRLRPRRSKRKSTENEVLVAKRSRPMKGEKRKNPDEILKNKKKVRFSSWSK